MTSTDLLERLRDLHEQLSSINVDAEKDDRVDEETIEALGQLVTEVGELVDKASMATDEMEVADEQQDLFDRVVQFNNEHPRVSQFLTRTTDLLAMMGI